MNHEMHLAGLLKVYHLFGYSLTDRQRNSLVREILRAKFRIGDTTPISPLLTYEEAKQGLPL